MFTRAHLLFNTVKYLKFKQLKYQFYYRLRKVENLDHYSINEDLKPQLLRFRFNPPPFKTATSTGRFEFLNLQADFGENVDWNFKKYGKLWNYNLQYAGYLNEQSISIKTKISLIKSIYEALSTGILKLEPYPTSLRLINVIRFISDNKICDNQIFSSLYGEANFLSTRLEFHLMGNHLLENCFALLMSGAFFNNVEWTETATRLLKSELNEQILKDGGHFELSPMYHQIILFRILELIDWYTSFNNKSNELELFLRNKASSMISWIKQMSFRNGDIPLFNDSAVGVAYSTSTLLEFARKLNIYETNIALRESGYRSFAFGEYECKVDVGPIGASYQPGHGHSDALGFILYYKNVPVLVEAGTTTYENNDNRLVERSTISHNTIVLDNQNQSMVYGAFRVAKRANCRLLKERHDCLLAECDGYYSRYKSNIQRLFRFARRMIIIEDKVIGNVKIESASFFHFHPSLQLEVFENKVRIKNLCEIEFIGAQSINQIAYSYALGFNLSQSAVALKVQFNKSLKSIIKFS